MDKNELNEARTNPDFLNYLEETREKSISEHNISAMYETLDSMLVLDLDEGKINKLYEEILKTAFENVEKIVNKNEKLNLEGDNLFYVRAFYEHAVEKWSFDNFDGAKELAFVLANIVDDELLEKSLNVLIIALTNKISVDEFYETQVDMNTNSTHEQYGYFMVDFNFNTDEYLESNKAILEAQYKNLQHLLDA